MKISNNALNFLLAQYRAIFKRAYVKGIASAVLLTAGLAAGQAQAASTLDGTTITLPSSGQTAIIDGSGSDTGYTNNKGNFSVIKITSGDALTLDGTLEIQSGTAGTAANNNYLVSTIGEIKVTGDGTLNIAIGSTGTATSDGLQINANGHDITLDIGAINVQNGVLNIQDVASEQFEAQL